MRDDIDLQAQYHICMRTAVLAAVALYYMVCLAPVAGLAKGTTTMDAAEANGTRVKPEYGSVWLDMNGPDQAHARIHTTIAVPGATSQSTGLPDTPTKGGAWVMNAGTTTAHIMTPGS